MLPFGSIVPYPFHAFQPQDDYTQIHSIRQSKRKTRRRHLNRQSLTQALEPRAMMAADYSAGELLSPVQDGVSEESLFDFTGVTSPTLTPDQYAGPASLADGYQGGDLAE